MGSGCGISSRFSSESFGMRGLRVRHNVRVRFVDAPHTAALHCFGRKEKERREEGGNSGVRYINWG